jgi:hypothetical protein
MNGKLEHLEVYVDALGHVCLAQPSMNEDSYVAIEAEEVDTLIEWLRAAHTEALAVRGRRQPVAYLCS